MELQSDLHTIDTTQNTKNTKTQQQRGILGFGLNLVSHKGMSGETRVVGFLVNK